MEYEELIEARTSTQLAQNIISLIGYSANVYFISTYYHRNAITTDPDDNKFFDAAIAAGADYLVTNDNHFSEAKNFSFPKAVIVSAEVFLNLLSQ